MDNETQLKNKYLSSLITRMSDWLGEVAGVNVYVGSGFRKKDCGCGDIYEGELFLVPVIKIKVCGRDLEDKIALESKIKREILERMESFQFDDGEEYLG